MGWEWGRSQFERRPEKSDSIFDRIWNLLQEAKGCAKKYVNGWCDRGRV